LRRVKLLDGKYELGDKIGQGGMGAVYAARNVVTNRRVAIKIVPNPSEELRARFLREARAASALAHPNVVQVFDVGSNPDQIYMVMELLEGESLASLIRRKSPLDPQVCIDVASCVLDALDYAHRQGIVHRDIKPENIYLAHSPVSLDPVPKLLDFGIARYSHDSESLGLTQSGTIMGTPYYMSPEQLQAKEGVDGRSDLYALGVILYECMSGHRPYDGDTYATVVLAVMQSTPTDIGTFAPAPLAAAIRRSMQREPEDRFSTAAEMKAALQKVGAELTTIESKEMASLSLDEPIVEAPPDSSSRVGWIAGALLLLVLLAAGAMWWSGDEDGTEVVPLNPVAEPESDSADPEPTAEDEPRSASAEALPAPEPTSPPPAAPDVEPDVEAKPAPAPSPPRRPTVQRPKPKPRARPAPVVRQPAPAPTPTPPPKPRRPEHRSGGLSADDF
jgi:serine/threonine-protein kinase